MRFDSLGTRLTQLNKLKDCQRTFEQNLSSESPELVRRHVKIKFS